ncbi:MAG: methionine--tRNA ligase, partial [Akkermansia sp.]
KLAKDDAETTHLDCVLRHLMECCTQLASLLRCVLPDACLQMLNQLNASELVNTMTPANMQWGILPAGHTVNDPAPIFPRILSEEEKAKLAAKVAKGDKK